MFAIDAENVADVLVGGAWLKPKAGTFEVLTAHRMLGSAEPVFRLVDANGDVVMGRLAAIGAVRLASEPRAEADRRFPEAPPIITGGPDSFFPGRPPAVSATG